MKYLKKFNSHNDYNTYITGSPVLPNVSYCETLNEVHYNPYTDPRIIAKFNVTSTSNATNICYSSSASEFTEIEIDGVVQPNVVSSYTFDTTGEHIVKYTLADPTQISDNYLFYTCNELISIKIPNSVTTLGYYAFGDCTSLTSVTIPDSVTTIGEYAFYNCSSLTSVTIPNSVTTIGTGAFGDCTSLISVTIPNSVTTIGSVAFCACSSLTNIIIPSSVTTIGEGAFSHCGFNFEDVIFESINPNATFVRDTTNKVLLNSSNILIQGFNNTIAIPNGVTSIGSRSFLGCSSIISIIIPNGVTTVSYWAFSSCTGLTNITIPSSVTSIGGGAFSGCSSLTSITSLAMTAPRIINNTFSSIKTGGTLTVPSGSTGYDSWMSTDNYYLGKYNWTKVEQ